MKTTIHPQYLSMKNFIEKLPQSFGSEGEIIYHARNCLKKFTVGNEILVVKSFRKPMFLNRIIYSNIRKSKAERSYNHSLQIIELGLNAPQPVAYVEVKQFGLLTQTFFINHYEPDYKHIREQMFGREISEDFINALAELISDMHNKGVYHKDLSPGNILFKIENNKFLFKIVDINRMSFNKIFSFNDRCKNFSRLTKNDEVLRLLAKKYAEINLLNTTKTTQTIFRYRDYFFKNRPE